jgi:hypothetical protein
MSFGKCGSVSFGGGMANMKICGGGNNYPAAGAHGACAGGYSSNKVNLEGGHKYAVAMPYGSGTGMNGALVKVDVFGDGSLYLFDIHYGPSDYQFAQRFNVAYVSSNYKGDVPYTYVESFNKGDEMEIYLQKCVDNAGLFVVDDIFYNKVHKCISDAYKKYVFSYQGPRGRGTAGSVGNRHYEIGQNGELQSVYNGDMSGRRGRNY